MQKKPSNFQKAKFSPIRQNTIGNMPIKHSGNTPTKLMGNNKKINLSERKEREVAVAGPVGGNPIKISDYESHSKYPVGVNVNLSRPQTAPKKESGSNILQNPHQMHSNPNSNSNPPNSNSNSNPSADFAELLFNVNDDHKTLISKNAKLRTLVVQASNKLNEFSKKHKEKEDEYRIEKAGILDELDRITANYKTYAESYKNIQILDEQHKNLQRDYAHNYNVLTAYQESLR
jgi:hypothetical protein